MKAAQKGHGLGEENLIPIYSEKSLISLTMQGCLKVPKEKKTFITYGGKELSPYPGREKPLLVSGKKILNLGFNRMDNTGVPLIQKTPLNKKEFIVDLCWWRKTKSLGASNGMESVSWISAKTCR